MSDGQAKPSVVKSSHSLDDLAKQLVQLRLCVAQDIASHDANGFAKLIGSFAVEVCVLAVQESLQLLNLRKRCAVAGEARLAQSILVRHRLVIKCRCGFGTGCLDECA